MFPQKASSYLFDGVFNTLSGRINFPINLCSATFRLTKIAQLLPYNFSKTFKTALFRIPLDEEYLKYHSSF